MAHFMIMAAKNTYNLPQMDNTVYSQWERQKNGAISSGTRRLTVTSVSARTATTAVTVSPAPKRSSMTSNRGKYALKQSEDDLTAERIRVLELKVMATRTAIVSQKIREQELIRENLTMKEQIQVGEKPDHEAVKKLLRRYEKFRGGMSYLNENFTSTLQSEESLLTELEGRLESELKYIQDEVDNLDAKLGEKQNMVHILNNYKDKEYPVKAIRIAELMNELDQVELGNDDEFDELERVIDAELDKLSDAGIFFPVNNVRHHHSKLKSSVQILNKKKIIPVMICMLEFVVGYCDIGNHSKHHFDCVTNDMTINHNPALGYRV